MSDLDLSKMDRTQKEELLRLLKMKARIEDEKKLDRFALHHIQQSFHQSLTRVRLFCGGNGSGKTAAIVHELCRTHLRKHPHRNTESINRTWFWCPDLKKVDDYVDALKKMCPPSELPDLDKMGTPNTRRWAWKNGTTTTFFSYEQDSMAAEGTNIDAAFFDEPPSKEVYIATYRGLRSNPDHFVCLALTPISEPWIYTDLFLKGMNKTDPSIEVFLASTYDNKENISSQWLEDFANSLSPEQRRVRLHGEFASLQGRVFKEFNRKTHTVRTQEWPKEWPVWAAIDPHTRKPHTCLYVGVTPDDNLVVIDELVIQGPIDDLASAIIELESRKGYRVISRRIDNSGSGSDWSRDSAVEILLANGVRVSPMRNKEKTIEDGLHKIHQLLKPLQLNDGRFEPSLKIMEHCTHLLEDMDLYSWQDFRHPEKTGTSEKPRKIHDDMIDPLRYIAMSKPIFNCVVDIQSYSSGGYKKTKPSDRGFKGLFDK